MQNTDYQMQGKEDIEKIQSEFLERILKVCKLEKKDISMQLLEILRYDCISLESISDKFNEILDEKQLNLIVSIADEYHLKYSTQTQRQKIEPEILQAISLNQTVQDDCIPSNICVQNNQIIENKYQEIQKEVFDEQSQNIKPNFETTKELDLNQPIIYQALDIENSKKNEAEFQDVLENIDSKTQQTSWIKVQKESMLNSKEKKEQIALLQLENTQMKEETITEIVTDIEIINNKNSIENNIQQQTDQKQYLIDDFVKNINEISQVDLIKDHYPTLNKLLCYLKETANLNIQFNESNILSFIENLELSGVKERKIISQAKSFITQYKDLLEEDMKILNKDYNMVQEEEHKKQFRNTFDLLDENKKQICEKQIKVMVESLTEQNIKLENKQIFRCQTIIAKYPEFENYVFTLQEIQKIENMQPINILDIYNKWLELDNCVNQGEKQIILQLQQFNFQRNSNLIEFEIIQKLLKALQNKSNKEIEDIFDILQISYKKMKEILQIWNEFEDEQNKDNQQPEFLNFKQFIQGQINDKKLSSKVNNSKIQRIIDLLKSTNKQDLNELDEIFGQFDLTQKQIRLIQQQYEIYYQKTINQQNQVIQEQIQNERIYKKDQSLSKIYTLLYQQKDYCLDIVSLKVICEFQNIQELINQLKQNEVKTIGLYGDFKLAIKIIQSYYPNSPQLIDLDQYIPPNYDQLVAITDGYLIFLILQDQKSAFEGDIFDNEENQLYIRFLLDSCSILITCLNQMQVSLWSDINPFEQFEAFIPPKEYKDRSSIFLNQIKINSNLKEKGQVLLSNDQNNSMVIHEFQFDKILDFNTIQTHKRQIQINRKLINELFNKNNLYEFVDIDEIKEKKKNIIQNIFIKHTEYSKHIEQIYEEFIDQIKNLQNSLQEKKILNDILQSENKQNENLYQNQQAGAYSERQNVDKYLYSQDQDKQQKIYTNQKNEKDKHKKQNLDFNHKQYDFKKDFYYYKTLICGCKINSYYTLNEVQIDFLANFEDFSFQKQIVVLLLDDIFNITLQLISNIIDMRELINSLIIQAKDNFLNEIDQTYDKFTQLQEQRIFIYPLKFSYDPSIKDEIYLSINYQIKQITLNDQAHQLIDYISFDELVDYIISNNKQEPDKSKHRTYILMYKKKKNYNDIEQVYSVPGVDISIFINQYSRQWIIFANDTKKSSIGKINSNYHFEEGRLDRNIYYQQTQYGNTIERVDSCIFLNEKNNAVIVYEKKKKQFYEFFLSGQLKEIKFDLSREISNDGVIKIQNIPHEESGDIQQIKNTCEGDFYFIQTEKYIFLTNPNYIVKHQISLKENFKNFKLIITENASLLVTLYANNQYECYLIQGIEDLDDSDNNSNLSEVKAKIGNIVIDKIIKSMVHYGSNYNLIGSPELVHQLFFYENSLDNQIQNFGKCIEKYFDVCMMQKNIQFKITHNQKNCFNNIDLLINKLDSMIQNADSITCQDLQFIMQTRIPIQLTTIQQANYLPLKDGLFKQDLMNIPEVEDQIEQIKKQISFGWIESLIQSQNQEMYTVAMCGRQSVGKSSQLNRMFGTRFGVSASRCTDGIWMGLSKVDDKLILVMDCEGLFSIRRTDDEEVKLLQQITSISDITIVFCDIDGINQPLLSLFKKLQICSGKMQSDSFFLGTMVLLTKNVQDKGDQKKLQQESSSHLSKKETKNTISKIFRKGLSYGFLKSYLDKDYDLNLQNVRDELLYNNERLILQFEYKPISDDEKLLMKEEIFEYQVNDDEDNDNNRVINNLDEQDFLIKSEQIKLQFEENIQGYEYHLNKQTVNIDQEKEEIYNDQDERDILEQQQEINFDQEHQAQYNYKSYNILQIKQQEVKLIPQQAHNAFSEKKSQNNMLLENIFQNCFRILSRINFNNFIDQMQSFFDSFIGQRTNTIQEYFNNRMPKEPKYRDIVQKFQQKLNTVIHSFEKQFIICRKKCNKCNRSCINISGHKGDCNCETSHKCYTKCQKCNNNNECFLISGHQGIHYCKEVNHLCKEPCQISNSCKELCTLIPHLDNIKHSCQREHKCEHQCRLYNKCGKSCSLQSGHEEINHLCDSTQCYDKCKFCDKLCGFNLHDHDVLLSNIEKNKEILMKEGKLVTQHLCGDYHNCLEKCEKPGVCSITYKTEEKTWETATSKFEYQFIKPCKSQKQCNVKIKPWQTNHKGDHQCESAKNHRCDQQCPECLSYCFENYNHSGNHNSKNHRNKEKCIFVSETDQIKINYELGNIRKYLPGESSTPENCLQSCLRMGRAHIHLRVCKGGDECAEKKYPFARHSTKQYKPYTDLIYDEMLCKGYWNSINWEPPVEDENLQIIQSCNVGCSHESHTFSPNYCTKQAWHEGLHQIDPIKCEHLGSGIVDICFTIDTTGSMAWAMSSVKEAVNSIVKKFEGKSDIMYCIVSYRDHPPQDQSYIFKINSQLTNKDTILQVLSNMKAEGGGDAPEAVMDGLYNSITSINWRDNSQRFIFHICDSPPHGKKFGASSSDKSWTEKGCPCGINEDQIAYQLKTKKVFYYLVKVNSSLNMMENIFKNIFGSFYKQTIDLNDTSKLNIEIVQALIKEINLTNEFYHIKD
ncbi:von willebrand factor type A domain protein (macronuclear) [Tetrahymena thermophila SB210]|uniref:von willebrand factor type A domain protein n=1 Tax=Tetrahymena thermophila (strain SB210) TaxID=312017 RepID=Q233T8_TETTS|nr:von willebrand factor type A domain protein [Tetrahymena thermophila SB210]EAR91741.2 von willebrand factor type A domain protein [Tetrahymena thermophila SB210]|eukprot:XP_001011986.2 von willebrand factor type A domain protein [Tetrahymena thermophila SB210]